MFVHLHVHTEYSLLDGAARIEEVVAKAHKLGMPAVAITDHGNMCRVIDFYKAAKRRGIKPIIGCEVYVAPRSRFQRTSVMKFATTLFSLLRTCWGMPQSREDCYRSYLEGFYYKPRVDKELLSEYSEGLIALSGCMAGRSRSC